MRDRFAEPVVQQQLSKKTDSPLGASKTCAARSLNSAVIIAPPGIGALLHRGSNGDAAGATKLSRDSRDWDPVIARDWWSKHVLGKTFIECRSFFMVYRCAGSHTLAK